MVVCMQCMYTVQWTLPIYMQIQAEKCIKKNKCNKTDLTNRFIPCLKEILLYG